MSGGGGSSPSNTTSTVTNKTELPAEAKPLMNDMLYRAGALSSRPYQAYGGERIAGLTPEHYAGLEMTVERAMQGSPALNAAQEHSAGVFGDKYMARGLELAGRDNPYMGQANPYSGENPYMQSMINKSMGDITRNYSNVINPQLQAMDRASGAFGNSGIQSARDDSQRVLAEQLGNTANQYRFQDYGQQAQLAESGLSRNAGLAAQQQQNMLGTYGLERANQMGALEFAPQLAESDYRDSQALLATGDIYRDQNQQQLNRQYDEWQQLQNYPYQQFDILGAALANTVGGNASAITSAPNAYAPNSTASMLSAGLMGAGALQGLLQ